MYNIRVFLWNAWKFSGRFAVCIKITIFKNYILLVEKYFLSVHDEVTMLLHIAILHCNNAPLSTVRKIHVPSIISDGVYDCHRQIYVFCILVYVLLIWECLTHVDTSCLVPQI